MADPQIKNAETVAKLTRLQRAVTQEGATEPAFDNEFWDKKEAGIYVDIVSGEPLFASKQKFDSGCGWPSFTVPLEPENVVEKVDRSHGMVRTEVRSVKGDSHLGHDRKVAASLDVAETLWTRFPGGIIMDSVIPRDEIFLEASLRGSPLLLMHKRPPPIARVFDQLANDVLDRISPPPTGAEEDDDAIPLLV